MFIMKKIPFVMATAATIFSVNCFSYDLVVTAGAQNVQVNGSRPYSIAKGTKSIELVYNVYSAEYPQYVTQQSVYNDVWSLSLSSGSGGLFDITLQVNSQLTQAPTWLPDSTTGDIRQVIDVSSLTSASSVTLQLAATSMNVGDSALATVVRASIEQAPQLTITSATPDTINANNGGTYYSIPGTGDTNTLRRTFTLDIEKSDDITLSNVSVTVIGAADLMDVLDEVAIPSGSDAEILQETDTSVRLRVRVTISNPASTIDDAPPPTRDLSYRFTVKGSDSTENEEDADYTVTGRRSLWDLADVLPSRYGARDQGGDAWGARGTYTWLQANSGLVNEVDDISGEHGRNIGHNTHQFGTDIDTYHFYRFPNATSGTDNYNRLRQNVTDAFGHFNADGTVNPAPSAEAVAARARLISFVTETRNGLTALADLPSVSRLYYAIGSAASGLPNGWARSLIESGEVTRTSNGVAMTLDLDLEAWASAEVSYNAVHNNHIHVTLDRPAIGE
jgi:hypothetical protein